MKSAGDPQIINTNLNYGSEDVLGDGYTYNRAKLPEGTFSSQIIQEPSVSQSTTSYVRYIFESSQSYWRPSWQGTSGSYDREADISEILDWTSTGNGSPSLTLAGGTYQILSGSD